MSKSEDQSVVSDGRKVTWGYSRKQNIGNYESEEITVFASDYVPEGEENVAAWVAQRSEPMFNTLKPQVWAGLGLDFEYDEMGTPKLVKPAPPNPRTPAPPPPPAPTPAATPPPAAAPQGDPPSMAQVGYYAEEPQFCPKCGNRDFYDNRTDVDTRITQRQTIGPDWKCKNKQCGPPPYGAFRPGSFDYNKAIKGAQPAPTAPPA